MPFLKLDDAEIHYEVTGDGPAMMFLAATAWSGDAWGLYQRPEFSRDHRVILLDQRGTGGSTGKSRDFSTKRLAADVVALLDHLGIDKVILCGHSNGGRIAQLVAAEHKNRVAKLILCSAGTTESSPGAVQGGVPIKLCVELVEKGYDRYVREHAIAVGCTKDFYARHRDVVESFLAVRMANPPPLENFLGHVVGRQTADTAGRLGEIAAPTLVLVGDDEDHGATGKTHAECAKILAATIPGAKLVVLPDAGHHYPFLAPETTNKIIREFLAGK